MQSEQRAATVKVVVATTVMLSFISFWRAAAIVLSDLASSAYYVGGIAETAVGKSAPWFILAIMLFSYAVRAIYIESCSMFVRGGVYKVVHEAMGGTLAKFSVSALMFDYVLTGPISAVSAGLYLGGLINEIGEYGHFASLQGLPALFRRGLRRHSHPLLLAQEHHRHARIQREGAADHADHHRHGGDPDRLVHRHHSQERLSAGAVSPPCKPQVHRRVRGLAQGHGGAFHHRHRHHDRPGPLPPRHERLRRPWRRSTAKSPTPSSRTWSAPAW